MFLEIKQIKKSFGMGDSRIEVLKGIDLEIERGEFLCSSWTFWFWKVYVVKYYWWD